jgi:hypothetical protein
MQPYIKDIEIDAKNILEILDQTIEFFIEDHNTMFGYIYAESGLPIFVDPKLIEEFRLCMTTVEEFRKELTNYSSYLDNAMDV